MATNNCMFIALIAILSCVLYSASLQFDNMNLEEIPINENTAKATTLSLINCSITSLDHLKNFTKLHVLKITGSRAKNFNQYGSNIDQFPKLSELEVSNNQIVTFNLDILVRNLDLETLILNNNPMIRLAGTSKLNIIELKLEENELTEVPMEVIENMPRLEVLSLANNKLEHLPTKMTQRLPALYSLDISGNILSCIPDEYFDVILKSSISKLEACSKMMTHRKPEDHKTAGDNNSANALVSTNFMYCVLLIMLIRNKIL